MAKSYEADLYQANLELQKLLDDQEEIEIDIAKKKQQIAALMTLTEENEEIDQAIGMTLGGLTEACLTVYRSAAYRALTPIQVKEGLSQLGFPVGEYRNAMAAIHTVIARLTGSGRIVRADTAKGETAYRFRGRRFKSRFAPEERRFKSPFKRE